MIYKLQNGWTIPLRDDYLEYLQSIPETYGGSIQPSIKVESLPKKFNGSQQAARTYAEGYQKGAKPVTKAIDNAGQKIFNTTKNVAMFVPGPTGAITWLGQMGADTANGEYSKVAKDLGAAVLVGAGLKGAQVGAKAAGRALAGKGVNIPWLDAYDYSALRGQYFDNAGNKAMAKATPDIVQTNIEAGKLGWAPSSKQTLWHNSDQPLTKLESNFPVWDITQRGAPLGHSWFTGTETTEGFLGARPHHLKGNVELNKPMIQLGEAIGNGKNNTRNQILDFAQKSSADGINLKGIADNTLKNQDVYAVFKDVDVKPKLTAAEQLGIPKGERSNPKALEDPYYWGYQQWNSRYNAAVNSGNLQEAQRLRDLHFKIKTSLEPEHYYHGTNTRFTQFDENRIGTLDPGWYGRGFYFTPDKSMAEGYASAQTGPNVIYDSFLNVKNPIYRDAGIWDNTIVGTKIPETNDGVFVRLGEPEIVLDKSLQYDPNEIVEVVVPKANQIKLADPITRTNNGKIIPIVKRDNFHNLDLRYKQGGKIK